MNKVIFINKYFYPDLSATSQILSDIAFHLAEDSTQIYVVCSNQLYQNSSAKLPKSENVDGVNVIRVKSTSFGRQTIYLRAIDYLTFYISTFFLLLKISSKNDTLIFKTDPPLLSILGLILSKIKNTSYINWLQDVFPEIAETSFNKPNKYFFKAIKFLRDISLMRADINIVIGTTMQDLLISKGIAPAKIKIISNWSDGTSIMPIKRADNPLIKEWELSDKFVIAYSGNLGRVHEYETIMECVRLLNNNHDIIFLFIGGGSKIHQVENIISKYSLTNIKLKPYQERANLRLSLSCADIHLVSLLPKFEGLVVPSKLYGIMAAGKPVINIGSLSGEVAKTINKHDFGISIQPGDHLNMIDCILKLKNNPDILTSLGRNARSSFSSHFDKDISLQAWKQIIKYES